MTLPLGHNFRFIDVLNQDVVMRFIALNVLLITVEDEKNIFVVVVVVVFNFLPWVFITGDSQSPK